MWSTIFLDNIGAIVRVGILFSRRPDERRREREREKYTVGCLSSQLEKGREREREKNIQRAACRLNLKKCMCVLSLHPRLFLNGRHSGAFTGHYFLRGGKRQGPLQCSQ